MEMRFLLLETAEGDLNELADAFETATKGKCRIDRVFSSDQLLGKLQSGLLWDLLVLDYYIGDGRQTGIELLPAIRAEWPVMPIVVVAEHGDVNIASQSIIAGANDFMVRSGKLADRVDTLLKKIRPHLTLINRNRLLREQNMLLQEAVSRRYRIIGDSPQILEVTEKIKKVAQIPRPVLITGERGTGKELVARAIHNSAGDPSRPLVIINCAAFSADLLESELFGHEKGSFTGANNLVQGKFELASGGTLFLDEIGNMSLAFQQKILRVVEYGTFTRVGGADEIRVNTRIIAATNVDLEKSMAQGNFLRDLYDRLSFEVILVPPLRQRREDIPTLAQHFLDQFLQEIPSLSARRFRKTTMEVLQGHSFAGNVRELKNLIERAAYNATGSDVAPEDVGVLSLEQADISGNTFHEKVEAFKERLIIDAFTTASGNQASAARSIGLSYHQYRYFLKKYG